MKEVIQKLQELIDTEKEGQGKLDSVNGDLASQFADGTTASNINFANLTDGFTTGLDASNINFGNLMAVFRTGLDAIQNAIISTAVVSDAQRLSSAMRAEKLSKAASADSDAQRIALAMRAEKLSKAEASRRALSAKEARQESSDKRKRESKTGIDLTTYLVDALTEVVEKEAKKGGIGGGLAKILLKGLKITSWVLSIKFILKNFGLSFVETFRFIFKKLGEVLKPVTNAIKKTKAFKLIQDIFTRISDKVKPIIAAIKKSKAFKLISSVFSKIGGFFKELKGAAGITKSTKSGGIIARGFVILTKVFGFLGAVFSKLGPLLSKIPYVAQAIAAIAGIFEAFKRFQGEDGNLLEKIIAGISGFFEGVVGFMIGGLLDLGKDLLVWILGIFGKPAAQLQGFKDFSFTDFLKDLVRNIFDLLVGIFKGMFNGAVDGFNNTEGNIFQKILGGIMGFLNGWLNGLLDGWANLIDNIAVHFDVEGFSFKDWLGFTGDEIFDAIVGYFKNIWEKGKKGAMVLIGKAINIGNWIVGFVKGIWDKVVGVFKNIFEKGKKGAMLLIGKAINLGNWIVGFVKDIWNSVTGFFKSAIEKGKKTARAGIMKAINLGNWIVGFVKDIWGKITDFFGSLIEKAKTGVAAIGDAMLNIGDALKAFIRNILPERDSIGGKILEWTGIYEKVAGPDTPSAGTDTLVDESAIIPPNSNVGEALTQAGSMTNATSVTVVNNNGGNTTNTTTSSQTNNTSSASPPVLSGSAMAM